MTGVLEINVDELDPRFARAANAFGKCDGEYHMRCPDELKNDFALKAAQLGQSSAWRLQFWMAVDVYGIDHVESVIAKSLPVVGAVASAYAKAIVKDMLSGLAPPRVAVPFQEEQLSTPG